MATFTGQLRQGLPREPGGPAWPAADLYPDRVATTAVPQVQPVPVSAEASVTQTVAAEVTQTVAAATQATAVAQVVGLAAGQVRQGLPRVAGGPAWPDTPNAVSLDAARSGAAAISDAAVTPQAVNTTEPVAAAAGAALGTEQVASAGAAADNAVASAVASEATPATAPSAGAQLARQGLPRVKGGEPWPAAQAVPEWAQKVAPAAAPAVQVPEVQAPEVQAPAEPLASEQAQVAETSMPSVAEESTAAQPVAKQAEPKQPATKAPAAKAPAKKREPVVIGSKTLGQWAKIVILGAFGAVAAAAILVLAARGVTTLPGVPEFLKRYPGEYHPSVEVDPGFPAWARWSHFLNIFLMVLIIRSGILVRTQQKPPAFWTPKKGGKKVSINLWLHTSLDILWLANGVIFVVLLFISGHWARIVPTSVEVFPNAASALLQYMTLDWPTENGWVNYNSLQQIMYFIVVFIAAPLAAITGVRMSEWWPEKAEKLNKIYPAPLARAVHFPTMLFFVLFILIHVFLVFSTGALRNLNHMFAGTDVVNWTGFWLFALAIAVTVGGWFAARPLVLAPIANLFGKVSNR